MQVRSLHAEVIFRFLTLPWTSQPSPLHLKHGGGEGLVPGWGLGPSCHVVRVEVKTSRLASIYAEMKQETPVPTCRWPNTRATWGHKSSGTRAVHTGWASCGWSTFGYYAQYFRCRRRGFDPTLGISCMPPG